MDLRISVLLLTSLLITRGCSQELDFSSFQDDEPFEWDLTLKGCQTHFQMPHCVYEVFCNSYYDEDKVYQHYQYDSSYCSEISRYNYNIFGEVHVKLKRKLEFERNHYSYPIDFVTQKIFFEGAPSLFRTVTTELDVSDNEITSFQIVSMDVLKKLNLSRNSISEARLWNVYELKNLHEIDFSHNTISSISVDIDKYVYKELKTIDLSNNYLVTLEQGVFGNFPKLETLDLSYNFIDALDILTFEGVKNLVSLNLKHNRISELDSSLIRFNKLETLVLSENKLFSIKLTDFDKLGNLEHLELSSNTISAIEAHTFRELTALKTLSLRDNMLELINKEIFANLNKLQNINLSKNNLRNLPKDLFKDKQISGFSITQNKLEGALVQGTFEGLKLVTELDLSFQFITSVEDYAFYGVSNLKTLLLNDNSIHTLSNLSFRNLRYLETLDLSNNELLNIDFVKGDLTSLESLFLKNNQLFQVKADFFDGLNVLNFLDLSQNNISHLETNCFGSLSRLYDIQFSNNPISGALEENVFVGLISLPNLDVSGTLVTAVNNGSFNGMSQLKELNLSHSKIVELQYNAFLNTGMIEVIDLSYNELTYFNVNATELMNLISLILNNNALTAISAEYFKEVPRLSKIVLANNHIESIDDGAFANQMDLRYLDLSYNMKLKFNVSQLENVRNLDGLYLSGVQSNISFEYVHVMTLPYLAMARSNISNITHLALQHLKDLDELVLSKNKITKVEANNFNGVKKLRRLDLSCNRITFIQPGAFKDNSLLDFLNISHNSIKTVNYGIFRGLTYLDTIDMSFNEIGDLQSERFYELSSLSTLVADHNKISSVNANEFYGTRLKRLSIGGNPIPCDVLVNLNKQNIPFTITAIRLEENTDFENVDGVTCNVGRTMLQTKHESDNLATNEKILLNIKDILLNMSSYRVADTIPVIEKSDDTKYFVDIGNKIEGGNDKILNVSKIIQEGNNKVQKEINDTNSLLDKILKAIILMNTVKRVEQIPALKANVTAENLVPYINDMKKQLEDSIAAEKQYILTDLENKFKQNLLNDIENKIKQSNDAMDAKINKLNVLMNTSKENAGHGMTVTHEAYSANEGSDNKSFVFIEVCVGLMLVLMIFFILYKLYNSGMFIPSRHSTSTRQLSDAIDNSVL